MTSLRPRHRRSPGRGTTAVLAGLTVTVLTVAASTAVAGTAHAGRGHLATAVVGVAAAASALPAPAPPAPAPPAAAAAPAPAASPRPPHLVVLGDSVAAGTACDCPGFAADLVEGTDTAVDNVAVPGATSADLLTQLADPAVQQLLHAATEVTVTTGANDFEEGRAGDPTCPALSCYDGELRALAATTQAVLTRVEAQVAPGTPVLLTGYWNVFLDGRTAGQQGAAYVTASDALTRQVNQVLARAAADAHATYVDLYAAFKGDGSRDDTDLLAPDGDHPDAAGHAVIARTLRAMVPAAR